METKSAAAAEEEQASSNNNNNNNHRERFSVQLSKWTVGPDHVTRQMRSAIPQLPLSYHSLSSPLCIVHLGADVAEPMKHCLKPYPTRV